MRVYNVSYARRKSGGTIFFLFALGVVLTLGLYFVKTRAQTAKAEAAGLERQLKAEEAEILKLKSELAYLENPARIEALASDTLGLSVTQIEQQVALDDIDKYFPLKDEVQKDEGGAE